MKRRLLATLLVLTMLLGMVPVMASADSTPQIVSTSLVLNSILSLNIKTGLTDGSASAYEVYVTVGEDTEPQVLTSEDGTFTAKLLAHRMHEEVKIALVSGGYEMDTATWTLSDYISGLKEQYPDDTKLIALVDALASYGSYAAYYADPTGTAPAIESVEGVVQSDLDAYAHTVTVKNGTGLNPMTSLYLDEACDLRVKFNASAWQENILYIDGEAVEVTEADDKVVYELTQLLPQDWGKSYSIAVSDGESTVFECSYSVLSYARTELGKAAEAQTGLNGLLRAMYLYSEAAAAYAQPTEFDVTLGQEIKRDRWHEFELFLVGDGVNLGPKESGLTVEGEVLLDGAEYETWFVISDYDWETGNYALSIKTSDGRLWDSQEERDADAAAGIEHHLTVKAGTKLITTEGITYTVIEDANYHISLIDGAYNWYYTTEEYEAPARVSATINDPQTGSDAKYMSFTMSQDNGFEEDNWDVFVTVPEGALYNGDALAIKRAGGACRFYIDNLTGKEAAAGDIITFAAGDYYNANTGKGITLATEQRFMWSGSVWEATEEVYTPPTEFDVTLGQEIKRDRWHEFELFLVGDGVNLGPANSGLTVEGEVLLDGAEYETWFVISDYDWETGNYALSIKTSDGRLWDSQEERDADAAAGIEHHLTVKAGTKLITTEGITYTVIEDANYHISLIDGAYNWYYTTEEYEQPEETDNAVTLSQTVKRDWWWGLEMYLEGTEDALVKDAGITVDGEVLVNGVAVDPWFVVSDYDWDTGKYPIIIKTECIWSSSEAYEADAALGTAYHLTVKAGTTLTVEGTTYTVTEDANYRISLVDGEYKWRYTTDDYVPVTLSQTVKRHWWWGLEMYLEGTEDVLAANAGITVGGTGEYVDGAAASPWFVVSDYDWDTGYYPIIIKTENIWSSAEAYEADKAAGVEHTVTVKAGTTLTIEGKTYTVAEDIIYCISLIGGEYVWRYAKEATMSETIKRDRWHEFELLLEGDGVNLGPAISGLTVLGEVLLDGAEYETWFVISDYDWDTGNYALSIKTSDGRLWDSQEERDADAAAGIEHHLTVKAGTKLLTTEGIVYIITEDANYHISVIDGAYNWYYTTEGYTPSATLSEYALTEESAIIVPASAGTTTTYAATELQSFIAQASGLTLEIVEQGTAVDTGVLNISLGNQGACPAISNAKQDSYATVMNGGILHIYGGSERAVLYGVYEFLEQQLGIRFVSSEITHVPEVGQLILQADYSITKTPAVDIRSYWTTETQNDPVFAARKRLVTLFESSPIDGGMSRDYYNPGHNLNDLIVKGGGTVPAAVCLADSALRSSVVAGLQYYMQLYPTASYFALKLEDGHSFCSCDACAGQSDTDQLIALCNDVASALNAASDREVFVVTYAYGSTEVAPTIEVDEHVVIELAPIQNANFGYALNDANQPEAFRQSIAAWQEKVGDRLWFYNYGTNFNNYSWYLSDLSLMLTNYQYLANTVGCDSIIVEGNHTYQNDWQQALRVYVASALLWDPNAYTQEDVMALVKEFCSYYFGSDTVYSYITAMEAQLETVRASGTYFVAAADHTLNGTNYQTDTSGVRHTLNANYYSWYSADFIKSQITTLEALYDSASGAQSERLAQVLFTAKLMYFANYVEYENKLTWIFKYDTYTWDSTYTALKNDISDLLTVLDNGYSTGSYRSFYNQMLFKSMLEIAGSDTDATLVPGQTQDMAFLTNAWTEVAAGSYIVLEQNGESRTTSDWQAVSGTSTAQIVNSTTGAVQSVTVKGTGVSNRFFCDYDGFAGEEGQTAVITISAGTVIDNGYTWTVASDITVSLTYTDGMWNVTLA